MSALKVTLEDFVDSALTGVNGKITGREDCRECKASAGWCGECQRLDLQRDALTEAADGISRAVSDVEAAGVFSAAIARVTGLPEMAAVLVVRGVAR